jgi:sugar O-acyltransferase (sialic acid O-acetyltransferase NeuD family)
MSPGRVVIIGAGGHAREVADILRDRAREGAGPRLLGFVADDPENYPAEVDGVPFLGDWGWFDTADLEGLAVACAVGLPQLRRHLAGRAEARGLSFASAVSPLAYVSPAASLGEGVMVFPHAFVSAGSSLGDHSVVNVGASVSHDARVGRFATLGPGARVAGHASVGEGCYLGVGSSVIDRVSIGAWATVGGGACVTQDLPENVTAVGVPARVIKFKEESWHEETTGFGRG